MPKPTPPPPPPAKAVRTWEPHAIKGIDVRLWRIAGPRLPGVPERDPNYCFRESMVRELAWAVWPHDNRAPTPCLLTGPKGCGKTSLIKQIAAECNVPVTRINLSVGTTTKHLKGRVGAKDGSTQFIPGVVTQAMAQGLWCILDEVSGATPPVALSLFPVLEPDGEVVLEDEEPPRYVKRHPDFRIFATDNTIGAEQEETRFNYAGTNPEMNEALLDRFGSTIQVGYLSAASEFNTVLSILPGIDEDVLEGMIRVANKVRLSNEIATGFSTRMVIEWARRFAAGKIDAAGTVSPLNAENDILDIAHPAFLHKVRSVIERDALIEVIRHIFGLKETPSETEVP